VRVLLAVAGTVIPFLPLAPPHQKTAGLPACAATHLESSVSLQGATGSMLGGFALRNTGDHACVLHAPLRLVLLDPAGGPLPLSGDAVDADLGYRALRLDPGRAGVVTLRLSNACDSSSTAHLWVVLPGAADRVDLGIGAEGRCDSPAAPPAYDLGPLDQGWQTAPIPGSRLLRVAAVNAPAVVRAGTTLVYTVAIANRGARPLHLARCPVFAEQLWLWKQDQVVTRQYVLNCRTFPAHGRTVFAMRLRVPEQSRGSASLEWGLEDRAAPIPPLVSDNELLGGPVNVAPWSWLPENLTVR
jgi:hypothetical protein